MARISVSFIQQDEFFQQRTGNRGDTRTVFVVVTIAEFAPDMGNGGLAFLDQHVHKMVLGGVAVNVVGEAVHISGGGSDGNGLFRLGIFQSTFVDHSQ